VALRLVQVSLPLEALSKAKEVLWPEDIFYLYTLKTNESFGLISIVVKGEKVEEVLDLLSSHFAMYEQFRVWVLPVEARLPALGEDKKEKGFWQRVLGRLSRDELYIDVFKASRLNLVYVLMVILATLVAVVGIFRNEVAVIIGAMVIAPFLGPNMGLALGSVLGDLKLIKKSGITLLLGLFLTLGLSLVLGYFLEVPFTPALVSRLQVSSVDALLGLSAGIAGTLAFSSEIPSVVVGVMVAVALLPPLVVAGLLLGQGLFREAGKALLLFLINMDCINLAAISTFFLQGLKPRTWWEENKAKKSTYLAFSIWLVSLLILIWWLGKW
jgi:uncharacterized hydrophobic protein (TIGR00341 family)